MGSITNCSTYILLLFLSILFIDLANSSSNPRCIESEREALLEFKRSVTDYPNSLSSWTGRDCCSWHGVTCHNLTSHVRVLNLDTNTREVGDHEIDLLLYKFNATISPWLFNLSRLEVLSMSSCGFRCTIPNMFGKLTALTTLDLYYNSLDYEFPDSLCNLASLEFLYLYSSGLQGSLPLCLENLTSLVDLCLGSNELSGEIPSGLGYLTNLNHLDLSWNNYSNSSIPSRFRKLQELEFLELSGNGLSGTIPSTLGNLTKLRWIYASNNYLTGELSESFFEGLQSLEFMSVSSNPNLVFNVTSQWNPPSQMKYIDLHSIFVGTLFPPWLQNQRNLLYLFMSNANISDTIPHWFPTANPNLTSVDLSDNLLTGPLPIFGSINNTHLQSLVLSGNNISGNFLEDFCNLKSLKVLSLANNQMTGRIPSCLGNMYMLQVLDLANNSFSGQLLSELGSLYKLLLLHLNGNKFFGELPPSFHELTMLRTIDLSKNEFQGFIPEWIGLKSTSLQYLRLESNNFSGKIPVSLCQLENLRILNLARNNLVGTIPPCLGNLSDMRVVSEGADNVVGYTETIFYFFKGTEMDYTRNLKFAKFMSLSGNNLHGEIPDELMNLKALQSLNLSNNKLTGRIPQRIDNLINLEALDLSINQLSGTIPQSLANIDNLSYLNLSFNNLTGRIPSGNHFSTIGDASIYEGNVGLCGQLAVRNCAGEDSGLSNKPNGHVFYDGNDDDDDVFEFLWLYAGIGPGFAVGFMGAICSLYFKDSWRIAYFGFVDNVYNKVWVIFAIKFSQIRRKLN